MPARQGFRDLMVNFAASFYGFDSKFFRTFQYLLIRPGKIVVDYLEGKRERYFHPARMYVFLSFIFFWIFLTSVENEALKINDKPTQNGKSVNKDSNFELELFTDSQDTLHSNPIKTVAEYDSIQAALPPEKRDGRIARAFERKSIEMMERSKGSMQEALKMVSREFTANLPKLFFLLMPFFALLLKVLYIRRDFYYTEHLIFTVYYYDTAFLIGAIGLLAGKVAWLEWAQSFINLWSWGYLYMAMKRVYRQGWGKTLGKFILLNFFFLILLVLALMGLFIFSLARL
jgi:hypothetical protein